MTKPCIKCFETKPIEAFGPRSSARDGHRNVCRDCGNTITREWKRAHKEACRAYNKKYESENRERLRAASRAKYKANPGPQLEASKDWARRNPEKALARTRRARWKNMGINLRPSQYEELKHKQENRCAVCGRPPTREALHADHCHKTGRVRGLLCGKCNRGVGMFDDSPTNLRRAAEYLEQK